jgi:hypothetical protein
MKKKVTHLNINTYIDSENKNSINSKKDETMPDINLNARGMSPRDGTNLNANSTRNSENNKIYTSRLIKPINFGSKKFKEESTDKHLVLSPPTVNHNNSNYFKNTNYDKSKTDKYNYRMGKVVNPSNTDSDMKKNLKNNFNLYISSSGSKNNSPMKHNLNNNFIPSQSSRLPIFNNNIKLNTPKYNTTVKQSIFIPVNNIEEPISTRNTYNNTFYKTISNGKPEMLNVMSLFSNNHIPIEIKNLKQSYVGYECSKHSNKSMTYIKGYAANTHQGTIRNYNEDRVAIVLNIVRPNTFKGNYWPKCSIFGIFDGHGGSACAEYLRDNLHHFVVKDPFFPDSPKQAIIRGFENAENEYINYYAIGKNGSVFDRSGSCAVVAFIIGI